MGNHFKVSASYYPTKALPFSAQPSEGTVPEI